MVFLRSISVPCPYHPRTCTFQKLIVLLRTLNCIHMGKGLGLIGNFRGRVGNVIGYELKNSRDKVTQGLRQWQPYVKNTQTLPQIRQRAKLQNINNVYRALEPIISRGFENIEYGDKSRNYFMKLALTSESVPFTIKDDRNPVPANYLISEGSMITPVIEYVNKTSTAGRNMLQTNIKLNEVIRNINTIGKLSKSIIDSNSVFMEGDELTFIDISINKRNFIYRTNSIVLNIEDDTNIPLIIISGKYHLLVNGIVISKTTANTLFFGTTYAPETSTLIGGTIILSRPYGEQRRLRSTNRIWFDESYVSDYYSEAAMQRAYLSYMKQSWNHDWQEQPINK